LLKLRTLFDGLHRLLGLAKWAGDSQTEDSIEASLLLLPFLFAKHDSVFSTPSINSFWRAIAEGKFDQTASSHNFWQEVDHLFADIQAREKRARRIFRILHPSNRRSDSLSPKLQTLTPDTKDLEAFLSRANQRFKRRESISRSLTEVDVHTLVLLGDDAFPSGITADQLAVFDSAVISRHRSRRRVTRQTWATIHETAHRAIRPNLSWTYSQATSPHIRICGFSLLGRMRLRDLAFSRDDNSVAVRPQGSAVEISCETKTLTARFTAYLNGGTVRGSAIMRPSTEDASHPQAVAELLGIIDERVLSASDRSTDGDLVPSM
jgi:hypothetical protein